MNMDTACLENIESNFKCTIENNAALKKHQRLYFNQKADLSSFFQRGHCLSPRRIHTYTGMSSETASVFLTSLFYSWSQPTS